MLESCGWGLIPPGCPSVPQDFEDPCSKKNGIFTPNLAQGRDSKCQIPFKPTVLAPITKISMKIFLFTWPSHLSLICFLLGSQKVIRAQFWIKPGLELGKSALLTSGQTKLKNSFQPQIWVCLPDDFNTSTLLELLSVALLSSPVCKARTSLG